MNEDADGGTKGPRCAGIHGFGCDADGKRSNCPQTLPRYSLKRIDDLMGRVSKDTLEGIDLGLLSIEVN